MPDELFVFSYFHCCDTTKALFADAALQDHVPFGEFINHAKQCRECGEVLQQHVGNFINSLPMQYRVIARTFEKQIS